MTENPISPAAIERIKALQEQYRSLFEPDDARVAYEFFQSVDTLLAALTEREERIESLVRGASQVQLLRDLDDKCIASLRQQLSAREAELAAMKATYDLHQSTEGCRDRALEAEWRQLESVLSAYDQQCQNEARWRNSRDIWEAERKRLQELLSDTSERATRAQLACEQQAFRADEMNRQLSASNAACAEMREALQKIAANKTRHMEVNHAFCVNVAVTALTAQPKQQYPGPMDDASHPHWDRKGQQNE